MIRFGKFNSDDLEEVSGKFVVLNTGSPLMTVETIEGDQALCNCEGHDGKIQRILLPIVCLSFLTPFKSASELRSYLGE